MDIPQLEVLNLGEWNCSMYSILADHNQIDGWALKYLPNLKYIQLSNVSSNVLQNIGQYCTQLQELHVSNKHKMTHKSIKCYIHMNLILLPWQIIEI